MVSGLDFPWNQSIAVEKKNHRRCCAETVAVACPALRDDDETKPMRFRGAPWRNAALGIQMIHGIPGDFTRKEAVGFFCI